MQGNCEDLPFTTGQLPDELRMASSLRTYLKTKAMEGSEDFSGREALKSWGHGAAPVSRR